MPQHKSSNPSSKIALITLLYLVLIALGGFMVFIALNMYQLLVIRIIIGASGVVWAVVSIWYVWFRTDYSRLWRKLRYRHIADTERYFLLEVELLTGRHHQIRCQLSHMGCPIKGDLKYGAPRSNPDGGICLQAHKITFVHPVKKEPLCLELPLPRSWKLSGDEPSA